MLSWNNWYNDRKINTLKKRKIELNKNLIDLNVGVIINESKILFIYGMLIIEKQLILIQLKYCLICIARYFNKINIQLFDFNLFTVFMVH